MMDEYGRLEIRWYRKRDYRIDEQSYTAISSESYITKPIDKLQISAVENDIGVVVPADDPTKTNTYIIQNNPLFYALTDAELRPTAQNLFDALKSFVYRPFSVSFIWGNPLLRAGDIVTVKSRKGQDFQAVVMSYKLTGVQALNGTMSATGGEVRETQADPVNQQIQALRMRSNQLVMDLEKTQNTLTTITTDIETVKDDITGLDKSVETITKEVGSLTLTSKNLVVSFDEFKIDLDGVVQAQESHKVEFDKTGQTIRNGGFRIYDGERNIFDIASDGKGINMTGNISSEGDDSKILITDGGIYFDNKNGKNIATISVLPSSSETTLSIAADAISFDGKIRSLEVDGLVIGGRTIGFAHINFEGERIPILTWY